MKRSRSISIRRDLSLGTAYRISDYLGDRRQRVRLPARFVDDSLYAKLVYYQRVGDQRVMAVAHGAASAHINAMRSRFARSTRLISLLSAKS